MEATDAPQVHVQFYQLAVEDPQATRKAGRPVYKDVDYVRIRSPGDKYTDFHSPANVKFRRDEDQNWIDYTEAFPRHWKAYQENRQDTVDGTPLAELPFLTEAQRENLRRANVFTAEQLAAVDGEPLRAIGMGSRDLKNKAKAYLDNAAESATATAMAEENADLRRQMEALKKQMAELQELRGTSPVTVGAGGSGSADEEPITRTGSVFDSWEIEDLKAYVRDNGGQVPPGRASKARLIEIAEEIAAGTEAA